MGIGLATRKALTQHLYRLHPRIVLSRCHLCDGTGRVRFVAAGRAVDQSCATCAGRGTIVVEA